MLIEVKDEYNVIVHDLNSQNGTVVYKLTQDDAGKLIASGELLGDVTVSQSWTSLSPESFVPNPIKTGKSETHQAPIVAQASEKFRILIR